MEINTFLEHEVKDTPNVKLVEELYIAMNEGDKIALRRILSDNLTWNVCPGNPEGGTYCGGDEINAFYRKMLSNFHSFRAEREVFVDGGDVVVVLGFYCFKVREGGPIERARFSHTWKITADGRIAGVWQVADSYAMRECLEAD